MTHKLPGRTWIGRPAAAGVGLLTSLIQLAACEGPLGPPGGVDVVEVAIVPSTVSLIVGEFRRLDAIPRNVNGNILGGMSAKWSSSRDHIVSVDSTGVVTAVEVGDALITAQVEGAVSQAFVKVTVPPASHWREHTCAIGIAGQAYCWGLGINGQLGNGGRASALVPAKVAGAATWATVTAGGGHSCGATTQGDALCWGRGAEGQLGAAGFGGSVVPRSVLGGLRYSQLSAGERHTCGLDFLGITRCWGWNFDGQVGNGSRVGQHSPVPTDGRHAFVQITAGGRHSCGLDGNGRAWCWGDNEFGQIGDGSLQDRDRPVRAAEALTLRWISAGARHTCGIEIAIWRVHCWGDNRSAQFGNGTLESSPQPRLATGAPDFATVSSGADHTCGIAVGGQAYCWGAGGFGQLGTGIHVLVGNPMDVGDDRLYTAVSVGAAHTCAVTESMESYCWGFGGFGQLGWGLVESSRVPVQVLGGVKFSRVGG